MTRSICVVTGSRAEYGLLRWVMEGIRAADDLELKVLATGTHLAPAYGSTYREIERDGFVIDESVDMLLSSDTAVGVAKSMGLGMIGCADALHRLSPDLLVVLGDRYEILSAVAAALVARIPVAHLHGGEATEGAFDESIRHAITKMSSLHFVAAEAYRRRVIQLGEDPARVFLVGGLGLDGVRRADLLDRAGVEEALGCVLGPRSMLVTFHPVTLDGDSSAAQFAELLAALDDYADTRLIFTMPNADTGSRALADLLTEYVATHANACLFTSLGQRLYLSCLQHVDAVVGNSSSGLIEAPAFGKGTINIGDRQKGRLKAASVIDCPPDRIAIAAALRQLFSPAFQATLADVVNPYGEGGASDRIVETIRTYPLEDIVRKPFFDLPAGPST